MIIGFSAFQLADNGMGDLPDLQWWTSAGGAPHGPEHVKECTSALQNLSSAYDPALSCSQADDFGGGCSFSSLQKFLKNNGKRHF